MAPENSPAQGGGGKRRASSGQGTSAGKGVRRPAPEGGRARRQDRGGEGEGMYVKYNSGENECRRLELFCFPTRNENKIADDFTGMGTVAWVVDRAMRER